MSFEDGVICNYCFRMVPAAGLTGHIRRRHAERRKPRIRRDRSAGGPGRARRGPRQLTLDRDGYAVRYLPGFAPADLVA